ncbi:MAG: hypothetical protein AMK72_03375 [Planctomycetes bacterium SM23_25]|nr:MAG: hypothetical protein AMK72_03375 [Planctomycetes bacterium SM23_25]
MWRVVGVISILLIVVLFVALNMHTAQVNVPFTKGFQVRTVFLVIASFLAGYGTAYLVGLTKDVRSRRR